MHRALQSLWHLRKLMVEMSRVSRRFRLPAGSAEPREHVDGGSEIAVSKGRAGDVIEGLELHQFGWERNHLSLLGGLSGWVHRGAGPGPHTRAAPRICPRDR